MDIESQLIKKAAAGHENSFSKLIDIYKNYIFAIILNFIKDHNEVENIAQEVFLQIYISLPNFNEQNFKGWIGRIATNKSIDWLRRKKAKFNDDILEEEKLDIIVANNEDSPETSLLKKEQREKLQEALNSIPDIYKTVLEKFYFQEKSYEEISKEENVTIKTIASRLYRAKILLKEKWREEDETL